MAIDDPIGTAAIPLSLGKEREQWLKRAWDAIDESKLGELNRVMASIASPTGEERQLAHGAGRHHECQRHRRVFISRWMTIKAMQSVVSRDSGDGADLLLYAPLDTAFSTNEEEECPWIGDRLPADMTTSAAVRDGEVVGMGAENPKGYAACTIAAAQAIKAAGVPLQRFAVSGLGSGRHADEPAAVVA